VQVRNLCGAHVSIIPQQPPADKLQQQQTWIALEVLNWGQSPPVPIGSTELCVPITNMDGQSVFVLASFATHGSHTVATLRSTCTLQNGTDLLLEIGGPGVAEVVSVPPGRQVPVPVVAVCMWRELYIRVHGIGNGWSSPVPWTSNSRLHLKVSEANRKSRYISVFSRSEPTAVCVPNAPRAPQKLFLALMPSARLENLLPFDAEILVTEGDTTIDITVGSGATYGMTEFPHNPLRTLDLRVRIPEFEWTDAERLVLNCAAGESLVTQKTLRFSAQKSAPELRVEAVWESQAFWKITVFCAAWILNKTGILLATDSTGELRPDGSRPSLYSAQPPAVRFRFGDEWTAPVSLEVIGTSSLKLPASCGGAYIAATVSNGPSRFSRTTTLTLRPLYVLHNATHAQMQVRQPFSTRAAAPVRLGPGETTPIFHSCSDELFLDVQIGSFDWSLPFSLSELDTFSIRLHSAGRPPCIVPIEIRRNGLTTHLIARKDEGAAPFVIQNFTEHRISFCQKGLTQFTQTIDPFTQAHFCWDSYLLPRTLLLCSQEVDITHPGVTTVVRVPRISSAPQRLLQCVVQAEGATWTVKVKSVKWDNSKEEWALVESSASSDVPLVDFALSLPSISVALREEVGILRCITEMIDVRYSLSNNEHTATIGMRNIRVLNDLPNARHVVAVSGGMPASTLRASSLNLGRLLSSSIGTSPSASQFLHIQLSKLTRLVTHGLHYVPRAIVELHRMHVSIDEELVEALLFVLESVNGASQQQRPEDSPAPSDHEATTKVAASPDTLSPQQQASASPVYVEKLHILEIPLVVAFWPATEVKPPRLLRHAKTLSWASSILGRISDTPLQLSPLVIESAMLPGGWQALAAHVKQHYVSQLVTKVLSLAQGSGTFGTTASFFTRMAVRLGIATRVAKV